MATAPKKQVFDYYIILHMESTSLKLMALHAPEIIEIKAIIYNTTTLKPVDTFQSFVKPVLSRKLSLYCLKLTGK